MPGGTAIVVVVIRFGRLPSPCSIAFSEGTVASYDVRRTPPSPAELAIAAPSARG